MSTYTVTPFHDGKSNMCALYEKFHECKQVSQIWGKINGKYIDIATYWDNVEEKVLVCNSGPYVYITNSIYSVSTKDVLLALGIFGIIGIIDIINEYEINVIMQWDSVGGVTADNKILDMPISNTPLSHIMIQPREH